MYAEVSTLAHLLGFTKMDLLDGHYLFRLLMCMNIVSEGCTHIGQGQLLQ